MTLKLFSRKSAQPAKVKRMTFQQKEGYINSRSMHVDASPVGAIAVALECACAPFDSLSGDIVDASAIVSSALSLAEGDAAAAAPLLCALQGKDPEALRNPAMVLIKPYFRGFEVTLVPQNENTRIRVTPGWVTVIFEGGSRRRASIIQAAMPLGISFEEFREQL